MKKKVTWMVVSGWMVAALLLTSCAPAVVEEAPKAETPKAEVPKKEVVPEKVVVPKEESNMVKWTGTKRDGTVVEKMLEKPKYGGSATLYSSVDMPQWDVIGAFRLSGAYWPAGPVNETLLVRDWTRGPLGTEEWVGGITIRGVPNTTETGLLASSWETTGPNTFTFTIRQGVHFALDQSSEASRLVGGRELTADDVVQNSVRNWTVGYTSRAYPYLDDMENPANSIYVSPDDRWTIVVKSQPGRLGNVWRMFPIGINQIMAPEVWEKYGRGDNNEILDWWHMVGTGPFMLKHHVAVSSYSYERNPNYWMNDPFFPENQLPYIDGFKALIIPDKSTMTAALRTGKISTSDDSLGELAFGREDAAALLEAGNLEFTKFRATGGGSIFLRVDKPELPIYDIRVRQALHMAINFQELKDLYWEGDAEIFMDPLGPDYLDFWRPLEEMSPALQELFSYNPDKAKALLAEAGYPDGFKTEVILSALYVDLFSVIKNYWADIGVDLQLEVRNGTVHRAIGRKKSHAEMYQWTGTSGVTHLWASTYRMKGGGNYAMSPGVWHKKVLAKMTENYFDLDARRAILYEPMAEGMPSWVEHVTLQSYQIVLPQPYKYVMWQPWLKGYGGATTVSDTGHMSGMGYVWIDQELKKSMGH